jgi:hypothetical protein
MGYDFKYWKRRLDERSDLTSCLTHLTRETESQSVTDVLLSILKDEVIYGSDPQTSFLHGERPAVCFQDAPLSGICQNVRFEDTYRDENDFYNVRYRAAGLMFDKRYVYSQGGRPVLYDHPDDAKKFLAPDQWWRIVKLDLSDKDHMVDWTHEREWRAPGDFEFELKKATLILPDSKMYRHFTAVCSETLPQVLSRLRGIVVMSNVF